MNFKSIFTLVILYSTILSAQVNSNPNLDFYPLQTGDIWFYTWTYQNGSDSTFSLEEVLHDTTLINGKKYFIKRVQEFKDRKRTTPTRTYNKFQRVDKTMGFIFQFDTKEPFPNERIIFNLSSEKGDTTILDSHGFIMICTNIGTGVVFNTPRENKSYFFANTDSYSYLAREIGEIRFVTGLYGDLSAKILLSAKVSGMYYGDSLTISSTEINFTIPIFSLSQNYPNPFNPETTISYSMPKSEHVTLKIYDLLGREVATLVDEFQNPGSFHSTFNTLHSSISSGVYFYRLQAGSFSETKKLVLMK